MVTRDWASIHIILSKQRTTKVLIRLRGCAGWSAPLLFARGLQFSFHPNPAADWGHGFSCLDLFSWYVIHSSWRALTAGSVTSSCWIWWYASCGYVGNQVLLVPISPIIVQVWTVLCQSIKDFRSFVWTFLDLSCKGVDLLWFSVVKSLTK